MELRPAAQLRREAASLPACVEYLQRVPLSESDKQALLARVAERAPADALAAMGELHRALAAHDTSHEQPAYVSVARRIELAYGKAAEGGPPLHRDAHRRVELKTTPRLNRSSMVPRGWRRFRLLPFVKSVREPPAGGSMRPDSPDPLGSWHLPARRRRLVLILLILVQTWLATGMMRAVLPYHGDQPLEAATLVLFAILFAWVSAGFWTAMLGFFLLLARRDRFAISATAAADAPIDPAARIAVVMPICNESVARVFAGLRATYESLARTGQGAHFDFFILSDSGDPDVRVAETEAWIDLCRAVGGFGHIFYRWRRHRIKRKSGNIADFCRRWGKSYRYMVVVDADSVMSGGCLVRLAQLMEANPNAGIIQTAPRAAGRETLFARMQQFATRVYGPVFAAGLHFWQLGESHYWGHNAIIRVAPFMRHCALARLPGHGTLSGEILSHDFVEATLMRHAGWAVWLAYDLPGSYEEMPPNLVDELTRDRRWCRGNLINFRLFLAKGLHPAHRAVFMTGVMAYLSAPLWFLFLVISTAQLAVHTLVEPEYFVEPFQLFPIWPEWHPGRAIALLGATATCLILPKVLSVLLVAARGERGYGGRLALLGSMLGEIAASALLAPIRMLFHTQFVLAAFLGASLAWKSPPREDAETSWSMAFRRHGWHTLLGIVWAGFVCWLNPEFLWWLAPVVGALALSMPLSVYSSRVTLGRRARAAGLFVIPEESSPPPELARTQQLVEAAQPPAGFADAVLDPARNASACASTVARLHWSPAVRTERARLIGEALAAGPAGLSAAQKAALLNDPLALSQLHLRVWASGGAHPDWRREP